MTLIANPSSPVITPNLVETLHTQLPHAEIPDVLDPAVAVDIVFSVTSPLQMQDLLERCLHTMASYPIDLVAQPLLHRRKRLLIADCDGTMIENESLDILAERAGHREQVAHITQLAVENLVDFESALRARFALLAGLPATWIDEALRETICMTPGAETLIRTMRAHGAYTCLASSGLNLFIAPVAKHLGFDMYVANTVDVESGFLTNQMSGSLVTGPVKAQTLNKLCDAHAIPLMETLAVGDGGNDCDMLLEAGLGVAFRTQRSCVVESANTVITHGDLTALLYAQGFRRSEFVSK